MRFTFIAAALFAALSTSAFAESSAGSQSGSVAQVAPVNVGNPVINMPASSPYTHATIDTNQAATGPSVFVNPPSADTCERAGVGVSGGWVSGNAGVNIPRGQSDKCDMRADTINLKVIGVPMEVIKARHCMDAQMAEAYARAGQPCRDARDGARAAALLDGIGGGSGDITARKQPAPWQAGG